MWVLRLVRIAAAMLPTQTNQSMQLSEHVDNGRARRGTPQQPWYRRYTTNACTVMDNWNTNELELARVRFFFFFSAVCAISWIQFKWRCEITLSSSTFYFLFWVHLSMTVHATIVANCSAYRQYNNVCYVHDTAGVRADVLQSGRAMWCGPELFCASLTNR